MDPEQAERIAMERESMKHRIATLLGEMSEDDLDTMYHLLCGLADPTDGPSTASHFSGVAKATLVYKHGRCGCGAKHDDPRDDTPGKGDPRLEQLNQLSDLDLFNQSDAMIEYNLIKMPDGRFFCKSCGLQYVSLEDRMVKPADECHGCQHKAAHG